MDSIINRLEMGMCQQSHMNLHRVGRRSPRQYLIGVRAVASVYGLTSLPPEQAPATQLLSLIRRHRAIENRCHWHRDATLGKDRCF